MVSTRKLISAAVERAKFAEKVSKERINRNEENGEDETRMRRASCGKRAFRNREVCRGAPASPVFYG
jgi:hypothetical protein